ncbi:transferase [Mycobacterium crocinum]|uniref:Class I SAM-dependent methyltransferase n=1 Tax=Mycolicibacterium crocinum TaxID=388459 RepID=A0ABY3TP73_9MYCO|nr:class I SAM-dependent methyltransferase [Mycolicibacterium crocinum]MCV7215640.1 transferase [Mycolicibacterium crocinum]ULN43063.1 class I SAM-dependent methyltransferase [Mycolicibacterium crocinum]
MSRCRGCRSRGPVPVLDLGRVPAQDFFPAAADPVVPEESSHPLAMVMCTACGLAQLADDDTVTDEPRGVEPQALQRQAVDAVSRVAAAHLLRGETVREFGSPHGGTWLPLLAERGFAPAEVADVVLDSFGLMHEPDQLNAFTRRALATAKDGVLLVQYHSLATIVGKRQWNALRHGHYAYYSTTALLGLLKQVGMSAVEAWEFDLYGGTVLVAARHGHVAPPPSVRRVLAGERASTDLAAVRRLQQAVDTHRQRLRQWLELQAAQRRRVFAYGAASRAVALFALAGVTTELIAAVADASPAKQGRRMPGTDVPIIAPDDLLAADPDCVLLTLPDLLPEVSAGYPQLTGRWVSDDRFMTSEFTNKTAPHHLDREESRL